MPGTTSNAISAASAGVDLLAGAAEDQRIAALETNDALALFGEAHHQRVDVLLLAGRPEAGLADQHLPRLAAGEVEHVARHQIVEQDHVGRLQRAHGAQGQQFRIARPGADQRHRAVLDGRAKSSHIGNKALEVALARLAVRIGDRMRGEQLPELAAAGERKARRLHAPTPACRRRGPVAQSPSATAPRAWRGSLAQTPARRRRSKCRSPAASG